MKSLWKTALIASMLALAATAQNGSQGTARQGYISVMSKAGTPVPRPPVPQRYVPLPAGAAQGLDYYYRFGGFMGGGGGSASPSYANQVAPSNVRTLPGYDTRPGSSSDRDDSVYSPRKRSRQR